MTTGERYIEKDIRIEKDKDLYAVFVDLKKAFDRVDWKERRLLSNLYMKQRSKVRIGEEMSEGRETGRGVRQGCPLSPTLFNIYLEDLMKTVS